MPTQPKNMSVPASMQSRFQEITTLTDAFCTDKLNEEYKHLCQKLTATLARKRPSPLIGGQARTWACGIVYAIGSVNFLFDKSKIPHLKADELCSWFGVAGSTGANKAKQIRDLLRINYFNNKWILPSLMPEHPMVWIISVNGFNVDARKLPRYLQEEAFQKGLIPYIPENSTENAD